MPIERRASMKNEFNVNPISDKVCAVLFWVSITTVIGFVSYCLIAF